jgi:hypothetical protein
VNPLGGPSPRLRRALAAPIVGAAGRRSGYVNNTNSLEPYEEGLWLVGSDGGVFAEKGAPFLGSVAGMHLNAPIVGMASSPLDDGYWLTSADGGVFALGEAPFYGSAAGLRLAAPMVSIASTSSGHGYWLVGRDGGIFTFGDAEPNGAGSSAKSPAVAIGSLVRCDNYVVLHRDESTQPGPARYGCYALTREAQGGDSIAGIFLRHRIEAVTLSGVNRPSRLVAPP